MNTDDKDYSQPVAYDAEGKPLYAHPPKTHPTTPQVVHLSRSAQPMKPEITPEIRERHEESKRQYPNLNLSESEYIISAVRRHPIGLVLPLSIGVLLIAFATSILLNYDGFVDYFNISGSVSEVTTVALPILLFDALIALGMLVVYYVYISNKFYLTNESVIQEIQLTLFSRLEQTVSLSNIEDASYTQQNIIQTIFNYGSIRLSTEGDETTYRFTYVANPKMHIAVLNNAVEAFKNGRPPEPSATD